MIVCIPFAQVDVKQAIDLIEWIALLADGKKHPQALLVSDADVNWADAIACQRAASKAFEKVDLITNGKSVSGWPQGANSLFFAAARHIKDDFWLWLEPDSTLLCAGGLEQIESSYRVQNKPFMGHIYPNTKPEFPRKLMSGIGVYPPNTADLLFEVQAVAWDMHHADTIVSKATHTPLIYHFYGEKDLPPTFVEFRSSQTGGARIETINEMVLENIPKEAVIFHRCKDSSLLNLLRKKQFPEAPQRLVARGGLLAVIAFCGKDVELCKKNMHWIVELGGVKEYPCLLSYDDYTSKSHVTEIRKLAESAFGEVKINAYRARTDLGWPAGANLAWQNTARFVEANYRIPWLWIEADAVATKPSWMDVISGEYYKAGKSFFGPVVDERGHMNGCMVYPWNAASRCPRAMACTNLAWDYCSFPDMQSDHSNAEPFIQHVWGWHENRAHPHAGDAMRFHNQSDLQRWLKPQAALFHRAKDGSLIERLRERKRNGQ